MVSRTLAIAGLLQGLWCPANSVSSAQDIDFETMELWPLSGGVADGVNVELSAKGLNEGSLAAIDFLTASYDVAFRFALDAQARVIRRSSSEGQPVVTYGGWPFANTSSMTINFLKTPSAWAVTINGVRMAWFDFPHRSDQAVVYAAVHAGFEEGWVVDERPTCLTECHPEECADANGDPDCGGEGNTDPCFARIPTADPRVARCTTDRITGPSGVHCCEGRQLETVPLEESSLGSWFQVHSDVAIVRAACTSFGSDAEENVERCVASAGNKVSPRSIDTGADGTFRAWVPRLSNRVNDMQMIDIPADVLATAAPLMSKTTAIGGLDVAGKFRVDRQHALITQVEEGAKEAGIEEFWFLNMFKINVPAMGGDWWLSFSDRTWPSVRNMQDLTLYLVDEDIGHTACADDGAFEDSEGNGCDVYNSNEWCVDHGLATEAFRAAHPGVRNLDELSNSEGWHAIYMCCLCGGGFHEAPASAAILLQ